MTFDELYGKGSERKLRALVRFDGWPEPVLELADGEIGVWVEIRWGGSRLKLQAYPERVHFGTLQSARRGDGLYTALCGVLPDFFAKRGVQRFTAYPGSPESYEVLRRRGDWRDADRGLIVWEIG